MFDKRLFAASAVSKDGRFFALGGFSDTFGVELSSVESFDGSQWRLEGQMDMGTVKQKHCAVSVPGENSIVVLGGIAQADVILFDLDEPVRRVTSI